MPLRLLALVAAAAVVAGPAAANPDAKRLYDDLLSHYNRLIRPVSNNSEVVTVRLGLHLSQLIDLVSAAPGQNCLRSPFAVYPRRCKGPATLALDWHRLAALIGWPPSCASRAKQNDSGALKRPDQQIARCPVT